MEKQNEQVNQQNINQTPNPETKAAQNNEPNKSTPEPKDKSLFPSNFDTSDLDEESIKGIEEAERNYQELRKSGRMTEEDEATFQQINEAAQRMVDSTMNGPEGRLQGQTEEESKMALVRIITWIMDLIRRLFNAIFARQTEEKSKKNILRNAQEEIDEKLKQSMSPMKNQFTEGNKKIPNGQAAKNAFGKGINLNGEEATAAPKSAFGKGINLNGEEATATPKSAFGKGINLNGEESTAAPKNGLGKVQPSDSEAEIMSEEGAEDKELKTHHVVALKTNREAEVNYPLTSNKEVKENLNEHLEILEENPFESGIKSRLNKKRYDDEEMTEASLREIYPEKLLYDGPEAKKAKWVVDQITQLSYDKELMGRLFKPLAEGSKEDFDEEVIYGMHKQLKNSQQRAIELAAKAVMDQGISAAPLLALANSANIATEEGIEKVRNSEVVKRSEITASGEPNRELSASLEEAHLAAKGAQAVRNMEPGTPVIHYVNDRIREDEMRAAHALKNGGKPATLMLSVAQHGARVQEVVKQQENLLKEREGAISRLKSTWEQSVSKDPNLDSGHFKQMLNMLQTIKDYDKLKTLVQQETVMEVLQEQDPEIAQVLIELVDSNVAMESLAENSMTGSVQQATDVLRKIVEEHLQEREEVLRYAQSNIGNDRIQVYSQEEQEMQDFIDEYLRQYMGETDEQRERRYQQQAGRMSMA